MNGFGSEGAQARADHSARASTFAKGTEIGWDWRWLALGTSQSMTITRKPADSPSGASPSARCQAASKLLAPRNSNVATKRQRPMAIPPRDPPARAHTIPHTPDTSPIAVNANSHNSKTDTLRFLHEPGLRGMPV